VNGGPDILKLVPSPVLKPWGLIHAEARDHTAIAVGLGELWLASAQTGPGNYSNRIEEPPLRRTLAEFLAEAAGRGDAELELLLGPHGLAELRNNPHRGKTEAWCVRAAEGHCGFAAGPRAEEQRQWLKGLVQKGELRADVEGWSDEVKNALGIIEPLLAGEIYIVPCGTLHTMFAVGPESKLIVDEIQQGYGESLLPTLSKVLLVQNSLLSIQVHPCDEFVAQVAEGQADVDQDLQVNPTVRVYDFGRRPGEYPELGFQLTNVSAGLRRVTPVRVHGREGNEIEFQVADIHLARSRLSLPAGANHSLAPVYGSCHVLHCVMGRALLASGEKTLQVQAGETAFLPGACEQTAVITAGTDAVLLDDSVPRLDVLRAFLEKRGAAPEEIEALFDPPHAL